MTTQGSVSPVPRRGRVRNRFWSNHFHQRHFEVPSNESAEVPVAPGAVMVPRGTEWPRRRRKSPKKGAVRSFMRS